MAAASSVASDGAIRSSICSRRRASMSAGTSRVATRRSPAPSAIATDSGRAGWTPSSIVAHAQPHRLGEARCDRRPAPGRRRRRRAAAAPSPRRGSASRRRTSASSARDRARPASELAIAAATKKTTSASQFSPSAIVSRPVGGMWNQLKQSAESDGGEEAEAKAPDARDQQHGDQVGDAGRDGRHDLAQRVDQGRRQRDRGDRGEDPGGRPRPGADQVDALHTMSLERRGEGGAEREAEDRPAPRRP